MAEVESRFLHLLQPIRDLTKNWEVDVAAQLGEYLEELDQICISFDNGKTTMNFVEAALLIQGSACVYSRKVEYLYLLVYQMLDFISNKKREKQPSSVQQDGKDTDASFGADEEEFLSLDDIGDSSQVNVDMKKDHQPKTVNVIPLTPMSLVPPEEADKRDNPLFSLKGEILASRKDFRMNMSTPHTTGAFLLEPAGLSPICPQEQQREGSPGRAAAGAPSCVLGSRRDCVSTGRAPIQALSFSADRGATGPDDADSRGDDVPGALEDDVEMTLAANEHIEVQRSMPWAKGYVLRERAPAEDPKARLKEMLDPWQSLDPFGDSEDKPFKKGRPFLVPHGLDDVVGGKRKRKGPRKLQDFMEWFSAAYNNVADSRKTRRKGPTFTELEVLYWKEQKLRMAAQRKLQSRAEPLWPLPCEEEPDLLEEERGADCNEGAGDFMEHEDIQAEGPEELGEGALDPPDLGSLGYEELVRRNVELFIANSQKYAQETELSQRIRCWEERIGPLLQEQEERATFDIHGYGDALVSSCGCLGEWRSFASLVAGEPPFEVCRYMLATLQLANDSVVELAQDPGLEEALDTARLRLLTYQRPQERFHAFQPRSACP
ncbi:condensin-2 complex subunit H2 isoform X3 [Aquila chrysaetos chrysaetos]|uniref:condensin-2 complex subunit H2 isoform X3 n=1 Tax=Aquila chrysaetos chrysaetos TaxID=223781 RepID=UPI001B7D3C8A|nr:condensin-2 complex subunit H2 isoform X3 [Aquila chrysaetos chrysaetos]